VPRRLGTSTRARGHRRDGPRPGASPDPSGPVSRPTDPSRGGRPVAAFGIWDGAAGAPGAARFACKDSPVTSDQQAVVAVRPRVTTGSAKPATQESLRWPLGAHGDAHARTCVARRSRVAADSTAPNLRQVHLNYAEPGEQGFDVQPGSSGPASPPVRTCSHYPAARTCVLDPGRSSRSPACATGAQRNPSSRACSMLFVDAAACGRGRCWM
jgi:hypothetical protein